MEEFKFLILNGRSISNNMASYLSSKNINSVIDLIWCNSPSLMTFAVFKVGNSPTKSDHLPMITELKIYKISLDYIIIALIYYIKIF